MRQQIMVFSAITVLLSTLFMGSSTLAAPGSSMKDVKPVVSDAELARLRKGDVVVSEENGGQKGLRQVVAKIIIDKPMDRVWSVISKQESLFQGEPHLKKVKVVNHLSPIQELVEYTMSISRFLPTFVYTTKVDYKKPENSIFFKRVSGSFNEFEGFCQLAPVENGKKTLLLYGLKIDIGFFVPQFIVAGILKRELPSILNFVEKQVHQQS